MEAQVAVAAKVRGEVHTGCYMRDARTGPKHVNCGALACSRSLQAALLQAHIHFTRMIP